MAQLAKVQLEANNTQERIVNTNKLTEKWQKDYERRAKRYQKAKAGQSVEFPILDNPADPQYHTNLNKRFEIFTKKKTEEDNEESEQVRQLKQQLAETQRLLAVANRKQKETDQHVSVLNGRIESMGKTLGQVMREKATIAKASITTEVQTDIVGSQMDLMWSRNASMSRQIPKLLKANAELRKKPKADMEIQTDSHPNMDVDIQTEAQQVQIDMEIQTEPQQQLDVGNQTEDQLLMDVQMKTEAQSDIHVAGQLPMFNNISNCTFNMYYK